MYFHGKVASKYGLAEIDTAELFEDLPVVDDLADSGLFTTRDFELACRQLKQWEHVSEKPRLKRVATIARLALVIMYRAGLRIGEVMRLRFCDFYDPDGQLHALVRPSQLGDVKTSHSRRPIDICARLAQQELQDLRRWLDSERVQQEKEFRAINPIFAAATAPRFPESRRDITNLLGLAVKGSAGRRDARPHWGRRSMATRGLAPAVLGPQVFGLVHQSLGLPGHQPTSFRDRLLCCLRTSQGLGHARLLTTWTHYSPLHRLVRAELAMQRFESYLTDVKASCIGRSGNAWRRAVSYHGFAGESADAISHFLADLGCTQAASALERAAAPLLNDPPELSGHAAGLSCAQLADALVDIQADLPLIRFQRIYDVTEAETSALLINLSQAQKLTGSRYGKPSNSFVESLNLDPADLAWEPGRAEPTPQRRQLAGVFRAIDKSVSRDAAEMRRRVQELLLARPRHVAGSYRASSSQDADYMLESLCLLGFGEARLEPDGKEPRYRSKRNWRATSVVVSSLDREGGRRRRQAVKFAEFLAVVLAAPQ
jgi:hypothetical protein